jgi:hypothetical protein
VQTPRVDSGIGSGLGRMIADRSLSGVWTYSANAAFPVLAPAVVVTARNKTRDALCVL